MEKCILENFKKNKKKKRRNECFALRDKAYHDYKKEGKCGTSGCPFFKTKDEQIEMENKCRERCYEKGVFYKGLLTK